MSILIVSSGLDPDSRSRDLGRMCQDYLDALGARVDFVDLAELNVPNFDNYSIYDTPQYHFLHEATRKATGLVLCSPVYNWGLCSELKKFIEYVGSTDDRVQGALFDKIVTFVSCAGLPHSYMAQAALANALMMDFKCIINPYNLYVHNRHWDHGGLTEERRPRLEKAMSVMLELCTLLKDRSYQSEWEL